MKENVITNNKRYEQELRRCQDEKTGLWGFVDQSGKTIIPCQWKKTIWFCKDLARVQDLSGKWGLIDKKGQIVIPCIWGNVGWFINGRVRVQTVLGGGYHEIDRNGNAV